MRVFVADDGKEYRGASPASAARKAFRGGSKLTEDMKERTVRLTEKDSGKRFGYRCSIYRSGEPFSRMVDGKKIEFSGLSVKCKAL